MEHGTTHSGEHRSGTGCLPAALLAELTTALGVSPSTVASLVERSSDGARDPEHAVDEFARAAGLRTRSIVMTTREAASALRRGSVALTWSPRLGWLALLEGDRDQVRVARSNEATCWCSVADLDRDLASSDTTGLHRWTWIEAGLAAASGLDGIAPAPHVRLLALVRPDRSDVLAIVSYAGFIGALSLAIPVAVQQLVNTVAFGGLVQPVVVLAILLSIGLAFSASLSTFQTVLAELLQRRVFVRACLDLAHRLPRVPLGAFGAKRGPELVNRFFDLVTLQKSGAAILLEGSAVSLQTATGLVLLSLYHPLLLGLSLLLVGAIAFVLLGLGRGAVRSAIAESNAKYALAAWMEELALHATAFRDASSRRFAAERADALTASWVLARSAHYRVVLRQLVGSFAVQVIVNSLVLGLGGALVVAGELTLGQLVAAELVVATVLAAIVRLGKKLESFYDLLAAVDKIGILLDLPLERASGRAPRDGSLDARGLELRAAGIAELAATAGDLHILPGERIAIVGPPASGANALADVLCGLRTPAAGRIEHDGEDLRELRLDLVRERALCLRDADVVPGSVLANVAAGRASVDAEVATVALARAGLLEAVRALPKGLATPLAANGAPLDPCQVAQLALARAIAARPRLLVVDGLLGRLPRSLRASALDVLFDRAEPWTLAVVGDDPDVLARCDRAIAIGSRPATAAVAEES